MLLCPSSSGLGLLSCLADVARGGSEFAGRQRLDGAGRPAACSSVLAPTRPRTGPAHVWCTSWRTTDQKPGHPTTESVVSKRQAARSHPTFSQSSASPTVTIEPRILAPRSSTMNASGVYLADSTGCRNTPPDPTRNDLPMRRRDIRTPGIPSTSEGSPVHSTCCDHQRRNTMSVQNTSRLRLRRNSPLMNHAECSDRCQDARNQEPQMRVDVAVET